MNELRGKRALLTGASGGIGRTILQRFKQEGAVVVASDTDTSAIEADAAIEGDLTDARFSDELAAKAADIMGGLDILVNNAGIMRRGPVTATSDEDFHLSMAVNVEAPFRLCRAAIPLMAD